MDIAVSKTEKATVVAISVDIDAKSAPELQGQILPLVNSESALVLDVSQVAYMSSAGLRMLLSVYRQAARFNARLILSGLSQELQDVMSATGFLDQFSTCETVEIALRDLDKGH